MSKKATSRSPFGVICSRVRARMQRQMMPVPGFGNRWAMLRQECHAMQLGCGGQWIVTCSTYWRPLPMMPKFCAVATAMRPSSNGLNFTE